MKEGIFQNYSFYPLMIRSKVEFVNLNSCKTFSTSKFKDLNCKASKNEIFS